MKLERVRFFENVQLGKQGKMEGGAVAADAQTLTLEQGFVHIVNACGTTLVPMSNVAYMHKAPDEKAAKK